MAEQTDWYERGCSRSCRNEHTKVWGWCDLAEEPKPELNLHAFQKFTASDGKTSMRYRQLTAEEARAELAKFEPEPTWRDVIRAMRAAGLTLAGPEQISERWRYRALDYNGVSAGDVATNHLGERWVTLHGRRDGWTFEMKNPTPAEVLAAARLVGLGGGDE
jgi:hypothetical protein